METIRAVCAIIYCDGKVLATKRADAAGPGCWEFAGGKIEAGETPEQACRRELLEEQGIALQVLWYLDTLEHDYPEFHLSMDMFVAPLSDVRDRIADDEDRRWLSQDALLDVAWLPADERIAHILGTMWDQLFAEEHL